MLGMPFYSVNFGDKNSWYEWNLMPVHAGNIEFASPQLRTEYASVAGMDGVLDMTEVLAGYPLYENRTGTLTFRFYDNGTPVRLRYTDLKNYLHGKRMHAVIADDPDYYYDGRFTVGDLKYASKGNWADVDIGYNLDPYKYIINQPPIYVDIAQGNITDFVSFTFRGSPRPMELKVILERTDGGSISFAAKMKYDDVTYSIQSGDNVFPNIVIRDEEYTLQFSKSALFTTRVTIDYQGGCL